MIVRGITPQQAGAAPAVAAQPPPVAVLPFSNQSNTPRQAELRKIPCNPSQRRPGQQHCLL